MAAPIRAFFHTSQVTTSRAVTNAFGAAVVHNHDLLADAVPFMSERAFNCRLEAIVVQLSSIHATATKVTMRLCLDAAGDHVVIPDTEATIAKGITTANAGGVAYSVGIPLAQTMAGAKGNFYLFVKLDQQTATLDSSTITWSES